MEQLELKGLGASKGTYKGTVRVVSSVEQIPFFKKGEILVCETTDPDWLPVFVKAGAVVTAYGSRLCHAAIVARELNLPCVVAVSDPLWTLKTGHVVVVDGTLGTVTLVNKEDHAGPDNEVPVVPEEEQGLEESPVNEAYGEEDEPDDSN